jgi:hypothetical protein
MTTTEHPKHGSASDLPTFEALLNTDDPRTVEEMIDQDEKTTVRVEKAEPSTDGTTITWDGGISCHLDAEINVGDEVTFIHESPHFGLGNPWHGFMVNGKLKHYETPWERFAKRVRTLARIDRDRRETAARMTTWISEEYQKLHPTLQKRIDRFRSEDPSFRVDGEPYEMSILVTATALYNHLLPLVEIGGDPERLVKNWQQLPREQQRQVPNIQLEHHSGFSFSAAMHMTVALLQGRTDI